MTKKHFEAFADKIAQIEDNKTREYVALLVAEVCRRFNDNFDYDRFFEVCGIN